MMKLCTILFLALSFGIISAQSPDYCHKRAERAEVPTDETFEPMWQPASDLDCTKPGIDAATMTPDKKTYFFKGDYYWRLNGKDVALGYPRLISQDWGGLPGHLDAALTWIDGRTFFFKGSRYWSFHNKSMDLGYPRNISEGFCGIPDDIDAAVLWKPNNKAYFFKGEHYWRYDGGEMCNPVKKNYPLFIVKEWEDIPANVDAALQWENGRTYIFQGEYYWKYNDYGKDCSSGRRKNIQGNWGLSCEDIRCSLPADPQLPTVADNSENAIP